MFCSYGRLFKRAFNQDRAVKRVYTVFLIGAKPSTRVVDQPDERRVNRIQKRLHFVDVVRQVHSGSIIRVSGY